MFQSTPSAREGDRTGRLMTKTRKGFNPRLPRGKATHSSYLPARANSGFNPRLPRGKATLLESMQNDDGEVSIHAFREGRRPIACSANFSNSGCFNPRLPRGKATEPSITYARTWMGFNPRLPRGKATARGKATQGLENRFNPRLPRGKATPLRRKRDDQPAQFQSTPSAREGDLGGTSRYDSGL